MVPQMSQMTVKSLNYESQSNDMPLKYNMIIDGTLLEVSIEKSCYSDKSHLYDGFSSERALCSEIL